MKNTELNRLESAKQCPSFSNSADMVRAGVRSCPLRKAVRMVRNVESGQTHSQAGRMLISGTFSDICAQIDLLLAQDV